MKTIALLLLASLPALAGDLSALAERLGRRDPAERVAAAKELASEPGEEASALLADALRDRDPTVREAAVKALGGRKDEVAKKALRGALKRFAKDPDLLPVVVVSLGYSEDAESSEEVAALLRKSLGGDRRLVRATIGALGRMPSRAALEALIEVLTASSDPRSAEHPEYKGDALDALAEATKLPFREATTWKAWWQNARRDYLGSPPEPPPGATVCRNDSWRFSIERPEGDRFVFLRPSGVAIRIAWRGPKEEAGFAWVDVVAASAVDPKPRDARQAAEEYRETMRAGLTDPRDVVWGEAARLGGATAVRHTATGIIRGGVARWSAFVLERNDIVYVVTATIESGATDEVRKQVEAIVESFRLLDG